MALTRDDNSCGFEALVNAYYRPLYQFALSLSRHEAEASDLTQQTFYIWARKGHSLREPSKVKTWLFTTLHREFLRSRRRERHFPHRSLEEENGDLPDLSSSAVEQIDSGTVLEALATLDDVYRAPLTLFYLGEHSYKDIAEILSVPIGTVQSRIARGKAQLRDLLSRGGAPGAGSPRIHRG